jgi:hypothetical protein
MLIVVAAHKNKNRYVTQMLNLKTYITPFLLCILGLTSFPSTV